MGGLGVLVLVAALCGVAGYFVGKDKGYTETGTLLGVLLGPIGLLILLFMRRRDQLPSHRAEAVTERQAWQQQWRSDRDARRHAKHHRTSS